VAFGQSLSGTARTVCVLKANDGIPDWSKIEELIAEWQPTALVIGLPYNLDGSDSELLIRATKFAQRLHGRFGLPVYGMDERLSSHAAIEQIIEENESHAKTKHIDDVAAQIILQNWLQELSQQQKKVE